MIFTVLINGQHVGTIDVDQEVYLDDELLLSALAFEGYISKTEVLSVVEDQENRVDVIEYETDSLRLSLVLIH